MTGQSLYNGNISNTTLAVNELSSGSPVGYTYHYDQLNRLKKMRQYTGIGGSSWSRSKITLNYQENITYDGNGNIKTYGRNGIYPTTAQTIDSLTYHYSHTGALLTSNKLFSISDAIASSGYSLDLRNQTSSTNYHYNAIGDIIYDAQSGITGNSGNSIAWSVYGKPLDIYKSSSTITYTYNSANQRVTKLDGGITTYYIHDAQGNVLAVYDNTHSHINWREQDLYGSSRLGIWLPDMNVSTGSSSAIWDTTGHKQYELDNHLGNVLSTVTDKRLQVSGGSLYFTADVASAQDYYPFGMLMPARQYTFGGDSTYRYGFNGKENDNEVKGLGNQVDFGARIYDPRIGRWNSPDPLKNQYPNLSNYEFVADNPIIFIDPDGERIILSGTVKDQQDFVAMLSKYTGYKIEIQKDGNLKILGESGPAESNVLKTIVFDLLDEKGKKYQNNVVVKIVDNEHAIQTKREGKESGKNVYFDDFNTGAFDIDDFRKIHDDAIGAAFFGHILAERGYVPDYEKNLEKTDVPRDVKITENKDKTYNVDVDVSIDPVFQNAHLMGKVREAQILSEFFVKNGKDASLSLPPEPTKVKETGVAKFQYGGVNVTTTSPKDNYFDVQSVDIEIVDPQIKPKI